MNKAILISACLLGCPCRYDGGNHLIDALAGLKRFYPIVPICPEQLGGLDTPRRSCEIIQSHGQQRVVTKDGNDVTEEFLNGAQRTLEIAQKNDIQIAILKSNSPSCGYGQVYDGTFSKKLVKGNGFAAQSLHNAGFRICNEFNYKKHINEI
ncbi:MAG: DUF523 domain-containing protein [Eubacteriales bacterium]